MTAFEDLPDLNGPLRAHRYQEYLERYREVASTIPDRNVDLYLPSVACALMALRRYDEALDVAIELHRSGERTPKFARDLGRGLDMMGACQWMLSRASEAISTWQNLCDGIHSGKYRYAKDPAGGVYAGLLLWFGASGSRDDEALVKARTYLENRLQRIAKLDADEIWPVPAARFLLGAGNASELIAAALRNPSFLTSERDIAPSEGTGRLRLSQAYLVAGAHERHRGGESAAIEYFTKACALENPISEVAWYLARYEVENAAQH